MNLLGLYSGRNNGIGEVLCKQALAGASDAGASVEAVNLRTLRLLPCTNCNACTDLLFGGSGECVLKDDLAWLDEKLMACDGIILTMPIFEKGPPGDFKVLMDRTGPSHDVTLRRHSVRYREEHGITDKKGPDERSFRQRPAVFLAHGGSDWSSLALPTMETWAVPMGFTVAGMKLFEWNVDLPFDEARLRQAYELGAHAARSAALPPEERIYLGDAGCCPVCHNRVMVMEPSLKEVQCAVCGVRGQLSAADGTVQLHFSPEALAGSHLTETGRLAHSADLQRNGGRIAALGREALEQKKRELCSRFPTTKKE